MIYAFNKSKTRNIIHKRNYLPTLNFPFPNGHSAIQTGNTASLSIFTYMCTESVSRT